MTYSWCIVQMTMAEGLRSTVMGRPAMACLPEHIHENHLLAIYLVHLPSSFHSRVYRLPSLTSKALPAGAKAFALDTRSKRQWQNPPLSNANAAAFRLACNEFGFSPRQILPHGERPPCRPLNFCHVLLCSIHLSGLPQYRGMKCLQADLCKPLYSSARQHAGQLHGSLLLGLNGIHAVHRKLPHQPGVSK